MPEIPRAQWVHCILRSDKWSRIFLSRAVVYRQTTLFSGSCSRASPVCIDLFYTHLTSPKTIHGMPSRPRIKAELVDTATRVLIRAVRQCTFYSNLPRDPSFPSILVYNGSLPSRTLVQDILPILYRRRPHRLLSRSCVQSLSQRQPFVPVPLRRTQRS